MKKLVKTIFVGENLSIGRGGNEVNGLDKDYEFSNDWTVISSFQRTGETDREFFLIYNEHDNVFACIRICDAMAGCEYNKFCVVHSIGQDDTASLYARWMKYR